MEEAFYIDANVFIFGALDKQELGEKAGIFLQASIDKGIRIYTSALTFDEFSYKVLRNKPIEDAIKSITAFLSLPNLTFLSVSKVTIWLAFELIKKYHIDPRDAIHLACAVQNNIKTIISEDKDFDKVKEIKRISLDKIKL